MSYTEISYTRPSSFIESIAFDNEGKIYFSFVGKNIINVYFKEEMKEIILPETYKRCYMVHIKDNKILIINHKTSGYGILENEKFTEFEPIFEPKEELIDLSHTTDENNKLYVHFGMLSENSRYSSIFIFEDDQFKEYCKFYIPFEVLNFAIMKNNLYCFTHNSIEIYTKNKKISSIPIKHEITRAFCVKDNVIYFGLKYSNIIGMFKNGEYSKIKIRNIKNNLSHVKSLAVGKNEEIYMLSLVEYINKICSHKDIDTEYLDIDAEIGERIITYEFGVYNTSYHMLRTVDPCDMLKLTNDGKIVIGERNHCLIYEPIKK
jgi:hypothetical protein